MKVNFFYSVPYDRMLTEMSGFNYSDKQSIEAKKNLVKIEKNWRISEKKIVNEIEKVSKLKFKSDVTCFLVKNMHYNALSHPLTIRIHSDYDKFNDVLMHELIHVILVQDDKSKELLYNLNILYPKRNKSFISHLPLLLIERVIIEKLFGSKYYNKILKEDKEIEGMNEVWEEADKLYNKFENFDKGIVNFFKNETVNR
ncbi:hypothetical protein HYX17_02355 [Candidatus Woesearchaeota archaeon]|nr:hypothetical protein [Candidatus Woesearchaeota archaeon]